MEKETVILVDAYGQIYRNYHAMGSLSDSQGRPTGALFGMAKFLMLMEKDLPSSRGAFVFDLGRSVKRTAIHPEYKANRPPMPDDLKSQIGPVKDLVSLFGWPRLEEEGFEADDIIAAAALRLSDYPFRIVSHDKDMSQIVSSRVKMLSPDKKSGGLAETGPAEVMEKFSVAPEFIPTYLALVGDNSDNIPGVDGVGPKTAAKLIAELGPADSIIERADKISNPKLAEKIKNSAALLRKNMELVTLGADSAPPGKFSDISLFNREKPRWADIQEFCVSFNMKSLAADAGARAAGPAPETPAKPEFHTPDLF
jgi:DNA polymerase-1